MNRAKSFMFTVRSALPKGKHLQTFRQDQGEDAWCGVSPGLADFSMPRSGLVLYDGKSTQRNPALTWLIHWPVLIFGAWKELSTGVTPVVLKHDLSPKLPKGSWLHLT